MDVQRLRGADQVEAALYVRPLPDPAFLRWLWRFWRSSSSSVFHNGYAAVAELNRPTFDLYDGLADAGVDTTLTRPGLVHAFLSTTQARHHLDVQRSMASGLYDLPEGVVTGDAAPGLDPALSTAVRASYLVEGEGVVDPGQFVNALADVVTKLGGRVHEDVEVTGFRRTNGTIVAAQTENGEIACSGVVIADVLSPFTFGRLHRGSSRRS